MSTVHFTLVVKMEIKIQKELLMRLKKTCIFLMSNGFPVTAVTYYCASLKVNGKGNTGLKKIEAYKPTSSVGFKTLTFY